MSANIELDIFLKREDFSLQHIFSWFEMEGLYVNIQGMRVFDDWEYTNEKIIDKEFIDVNMHDNLLQKFMLINFIVNRKWKCVLITSFLDNKYMNLSFGLDIDGFLECEEAARDDLIMKLYNQVADFIDIHIGEGKLKSLFIAASMGIEYSVGFNSDTLMMINNNDGVKKWIAPKNVGENLALKQFAKEEKTNITLFTRSQ